MHALTIQYFEVVQIYRVVVELARTTRCLFVPMKLVTFTDDVLRRFRAVIANAGLVPEIRALAFAQPNQLAIVAPNKNGFWELRQLEEIKQATGDAAALPNSLTAYLPVTGLELKAVGGSDQAVMDHYASLAITTRQGVRVTLPLVDVDVTTNAWNPRFQVDLDGFKPTDIASLALVKKKTTKAGGGDDFDHFAGTINAVLRFNIKLSDGTYASVKVDTPALALRAPVTAKADEHETVLFMLQSSLGESDIIQHLTENALHYSSAIWRSLDAATITTMLATYGFDSRPLIEMIDPVPVTVNGNYIVFRFYNNEFDHGNWLEFLQKHDLKNPKSVEDLVPLPSGGVFAEAVLGRSNSAEKLDITRFWNWQDSSILILPPEINPLTAGGKESDPNVRTAPLEGQILNIVNPPALPDPAGLAPLYNAIANGNMFRDMSGLAQTAALAQAALQAAQTGTGQATTAAGQAQQVAAQQLNDLLKVIGQVALAAMSSGGSSAGAALLGSSTGGGTPGVTKGATNAGALIRHGQDMDNRGVPSQTSNGTGNDSSGGTGGLSSGYRAAVGNEGAAFSSALGGGPSGVLGQLLKTAQGQVPVGVPVMASSAWPKLNKAAVLARLNELKGNADLFNQGSIGLCTAAAFYHHIIQKDPLQFHSFATGLHGQGIGFLGKLNVAPGDDLRNTDYNALARKWCNGMPPLADWMLMSALRDSENWFFDFEGSPDETVAMRTSAQEMSNWYESTGFYSSIDYSSDKSLAKIKTIQKTANNHVALWIAIKLLGDPRDGTHMITLESPMMIDEANNKVRFNYWTWGQPVKTLDTTVDALTAHYCGVITATF